MVKRILIISLALKMLKLELIYLIYIFSKYIFLPKIRRYRKDFDETKYKKNIMKTGKKLKIVLKKNLIVKLYTMKNIKKLNKIR